MYPSKKDIKQAIDNAKAELGVSGAEFSKLSERAFQFYDKHGIYIKPGYNGAWLAYYWQSLPDGGAAQYSIPVTASQWMDAPSTVIKAVQEASAAV